MEHQAYGTTASRYWPIIMDLRMEKDHKYDSAKYLQGKERGKLNFFLLEKFFGLSLVIRDDFPISGRHLHKWSFFQEKEINDFSVYTRIA